MKLAPPDKRKALSARRTMFVLAAVALLPLLLHGSAPSWWSSRGVLIENATADDYAPANQGQLKNIAKAAVAEMDAKFGGGAGDELHSLISSWLTPSASTNDFAPVNLGQLKTVAKLFYDRLIAEGLVDFYPWLTSLNSPDDFAVANIGQVKKLFSFEIRLNPVNDPFQNRLAAGQRSGNLALEAGAVWFWANRFGLDSSFQNTYPRRLTGLSGIRSVSAGDDHRVLLTVSGTVLTWGKNNYGQLGDGTNVDRDTPVTVPNLANIVSVKAGAAYTLALQQDGTVLAWGENYYGQLGNGDNIASSNPVQVVELSGVRKIAAGPYRSVALKEDGTVWTWGYDHYANGQDLSNNTPIQVSDLIDVIDVAVGYEHVVAVKADGTVWAWGSNYSNQIGNGAPASAFIASPVQVSNLANVVKVASNYDHSLAVLSDGTVWAWGENNFGQLGDGTTARRQRPVQVSGLTAVVAVATNYQYSLAMKADGTVWTWGEGSSGTVPGADLRVPQPVGLGLFDANHNGLDDRWELEYFGNLDQTANGDFDSDGISNLQELMRGTDPRDYFNGVPPIVEIAGGNNQIGGPGAFLNKPFRVRLRNAAGQLLVNAPVRFTISGGAGSLSTTFNGPQVQSLLLRTDTNGEAAAYHALPNAPGSSTRTIVSADGSAASASVTFRGIVQFSLPPTPTPPPDPNASPTPTPSPTAIPIAPYRYAIIDLGKDRYPKRINNQGQILIVGTDDNDTWGSFRWKGGVMERLTYAGMTDLPPVADMNDQGVAVGYFWQVAPWVSNAENEREAGLTWAADTSEGVKTTAPVAAPSWGFRLPGTVKQAFFSAINNENDVFGGVRTSGGYEPTFNNEFFVYNAYRWTGTATTQLSFGAATFVPASGTFAFSGAVDEISRANRNGHYIGTKLIPQRVFPNPAIVEGTSTGMIDGQTVSFFPVDINETGIVAGSAGADMIVYSSPTSQVTISGASPLAINDHTRPAPSPLPQSFPGSSPSPTPIPIPQILAWAGNALVIWERQEGGQTWHPFGLEEMIPSMEGWDYIEPYDMNDTGAIVGRGWYTGASAPGAPGEYHAFLLVPVELMVDGNRDGDMSLATVAADRTTDEAPYKFWLNNDHDVYHIVDREDTDYDDANDALRDCENRAIDNMRDLEDFTRLRVSFGGLTNLVKQPDIVVSLEWRSREGAEIIPAQDGIPEIVIYQENQANTRSEYLENEVSASRQRESSYDGWIGTVRAGQSLNLFATHPSLRDSLSQNNSIIHLLFCGKTAGRGRLTAVIRQRGKVIAEYPAAALDLLDIKDMYERWTADAENGVPEFGGDVPSVVAHLTHNRLPVGYVPSGHTRPFAYTVDDAEQPKYILYIHGWNMTPVEKEQFAETAYKRLFWRGYKGRFGVFEWPTTHSFDPLKNKFDPLFDPTNYDRGEWSAWRSAPALRNVLAEANQTYPGQVYVFAHSMGNVVVGEALRLHSQHFSGQIVNTYVASQAALPAHCYDGAIAEDLPLRSNLQWTYDHPGIPGPGYNYGPATPNIYRNWLAFNRSAVGRGVNFRNLNDYALTPEVWQFNEITKPDWRDMPDQPWDYAYSGDPEQPPSPIGFWKSRDDGNEDDTVVTLQLGDRADVRDRYEIMSFDAEPRSRALGGSANVNGLSEVDLQGVWPPDDSPGTLRRFGDYSAHKWHSAQFRSTNMRQKDYWEALLGDEGFRIKGSRP
jgi:alpha-tubulin suppressor-like RCC1 family protein